MQEDNAALHLASVGQAAGQLLAQHLMQPHVKSVTIGTGSALRAAIEAMPLVPQPELAIYPATGCLSQDLQSSALEALTLIERRTGARAHQIPAPFMPSTSTQAVEFPALRPIKQLLESAAKSELMVTSLQKVSAKSGLIDDGLVSATQVGSLLEFGAIVELFGTFFNAQGQPISNQSAPKAISLDRDVLFSQIEQKKCRTIVVAAEQERDKIRTEMEQYRAAGCKYLELRVGIQPEKDIELIRFAAEIAKPREVVYADANCRWTLLEAMKVAQAIDDLDVMIEQPCFTYEDRLHVRANTNLSMKLDELVTDQFIAERITRDRAANVACVKIARIGGLTKARRIRYIFVDQGVKVVTECMMGGEIISAAVAHFAASTTAELLFNTTDLHAYNKESTGSPAPPTSDGRLYCHNTPGLGVEPDFKSLGDPVAVYE